MDDLLERTLALLGGGAAGGVTIKEPKQKLLARPAVDPGGGTYLTWLRPLPHCDTKSYADMIRIVAWCVRHLGAVQLVLILLGDGQTVLRMRDLKRKQPSLYKHVCNGGFHSHAHFMFAVEEEQYCLPGVARRNHAACGRSSRAAQHGRPCATRVAGREQSREGKRARTYAFEPCPWCVVLHSRRRAITTTPASV